MDRSTPVFEAYGVAHLSALALLPIAVITLICWHRSGRAQKALRAVEIALAIGLLLNSPLTALIAWNEGEFTLNHVLPFHLCDLAALLGAWALLRPNQTVTEFLFYWGIAGTTQGLLTPALNEGFPAPFFFVFFYAHLTIPAIALYLTLGKGQRPRPRSWLKVWLATQLYVLVMFPFNLLTKTNFGYFREKPPTGSALDFFGPWPAYILVMEILALLFFILLYLPFQNREGGKTAPTS